MRPRLFKTLLVSAATVATMGAMMSSKDNEGRIDYVEFGAIDLERTKAFFGDAFGWKFTDYGPDYTSFADGRLTGGFRRENATPGGPLVVLYSAHLEETQRRLQAAGGTISKPIFSFPGGRRFHFRDPNGNELAVWSDK